MRWGVRAACPDDVLLVAEENSTRSEPRKWYGGEEEGGQEAYGTSNAACPEHFLV